MLRDFKLGGYRLENYRASHKRFMAIVLLIAIAALCVSTQDQQRKQSGLQQYIARLETAGRRQADGIAVTAISPRQPLGDAQNMLSQSKFTVALVFRLYP